MLTWPALVAEMKSLLEKNEKCLRQIARNLEGGMVCYLMFLFVFHFVLIMIFFQLFAFLLSFKLCFEFEIVVQTNYKLAKILSDMLGALRD